MGGAGDGSLLSMSGNARSFTQRPRAQVLFAAIADWRPRLAHLSAVLAPFEAEKVRRRHRLVDRDGLVLAYALQRLLLGSAMRLAPQAVPLLRDERGRPSVDGESFGTSLSHAGGAVAVAVCAGQPIGIDLEPVTAVASMHEIGSRIASQEEADAVAGMSWYGRGEALLGLWVRKEAVLKAAGVGLAIEMDRFAAPDGATARPPGCAGPFHVRMLGIGPQWRAAIALRRATDVAWAWAIPDSYGGVDVIDSQCVAIYGADASVGERSGV